MSNTRVLLVEDDQRLGELQRDYLVQQGMEVSWLRDGYDVDLEIGRFKPDVVVLDLMLPGRSGLDVCKTIRNNFKGSILFLSASEDDIDHVACIEVGADDFVSKPIKPRVLLARIRMLLRSRSGGNAANSSGNIDDQLNYGRLWLKKKTREVTFAENPIKLSASEFTLLWILASKPDQVLERSVLFKQLRGIEFDGVDRSVDTKIVSLRKKFGDSGDTPKKIVTIRNHGYMFCSDSWE